MAENKPMTTEEIQQRINEILRDERLSYPAATIDINAPLALIQLSLEIELHTLQRVIGQQLTNVDNLKEEQNNG